MKSTSTPDLLLRGVLAGALGVLAALAACLVRDPAVCTPRVPDCPSPELPYCDLVTQRCLPGPPGDGGADGGGDAGRCAEDRACPAATPICQDGACRPCGGAAEDARCAGRSAGAGRCALVGAQAGGCVACRLETQASDCGGMTPVCGEDGVCRGCARHADCASGACKPDGSCATAAEVAYVNNAAAGCSDADHASTPQAPFCEASAAVALGKWRYVVVAGSATAYRAVSVNASASDVEVVIIGPGRGAATKALLTSASAPAVLVQTSGKGAKVELTGLVLTGSAGATKSAGTRCVMVSGAATLIIRDSTVTDSGAAGVDISGCVVELDGNLIGPGNAGGGLKLVSASYRVTNNIIAGNGPGGRGVSIDDGSMGTFSFNTVSNNVVGAGSGVGGIDCGAGIAKLIFGSIIAKNTTDGVTQVGPKCTMDQTVTGAGAPAGIAIDPAFVNIMTNDYHLIPDDPKNQACCIDQVAAPTTPNADHDVDGVRRPKGVRWDIGAHEAR